MLIETKTIYYKNFILQAWAVLEAQAAYRAFPRLRIICDACCRVPESRQHIPQHQARGKAACGYVMLGLGDEIVEQKAKYLGELTIDQAEYRAIIFALDRAAAFCRKELEIWLDSEVIVGQLNGIFCLRSDRVKPLFDEVKKLENRFGKVSYFHHNRGSFWARAADKLANDEYSRLQKG
jgi:ribonuclease HI